MLPLALAFLVVGASQPPVIHNQKAVSRMVGFSFLSNLVPLAIDPQVALGSLLRQLRPDLVRIPIYWDEVAPTPDRLDFAAIDKLLATVTSYNLQHRRGHAQVILVVGVRNLAWPEVHLPSWTETTTPLHLAQVTSSGAYIDYLQETFKRYAGSPLLYAWQVENEPLDSTNEELGEVALNGKTVADEVALLKVIDARHRVIVTTYNSASVDLDIEATSQFSWLLEALPGPKPAGHPEPALELGDILGLDVYVVTPSTPLADASAAQRIAWKTATLSYWAERAGKSGKELWITEMQGAPWGDQPGFSEDDLVDSANHYAETGATAVLLWGVESWLNEPTWMKAGKTALLALRA